LGSRRFLCAPRPRGGQSRDPSSQRCIDASNKALAKVMKTQRDENDAAAVTEQIGLLADVQCFVFDVGVVASAARPRFSSVSQTMLR
jgi:hypothetical protein